MNMEESEITAKVIAIVAEVKKLNAASVRPESTFEQLGIDSLDTINILYELENAFDVEIPDDEARGVKSIQDIVERLAARRQQQPAADAS